MEVVASVSGMQSLSRDWPSETSVGFVPTMGYLHEGHLSLVRESKRRCGITVVSIFVNPSQFGPREDLGSYPRDLERDLKLLEELRVDYVFNPSAEEIYPPCYSTWVNVERLSEGLCGASRPGHFRGVATVVLKLANLVAPQLMFMGEKDFQQVAVLRQMLTDLNSPCEIVPCPIVREPDGLAMSSRNVYLDPSRRKQALCLSQAIRLAQDAYRSGETDCSALRGIALGHIASSGGKADYVSLVDSVSLRETEQATSQTRIILAVYIGTTRLIDNAAISGRLP